MPAVRVKADELAARCYPGLTGDIDSMHALLREFATSSSHYARVIGPIGEPRAALLAQTGKNVWAMRSPAAAILWYSDLPGAGAALLRDFRRWAQEHRKRVVVAGFTADWLMADERALKLADRIGFKQHGPGGYVYFPKGAAAVVGPLPSKHEAHERMKAAMESEQ